MGIVAIVSEYYNANNETLTDSSKRADKEDKTNKTAVTRVASLA